MFSNASFSLIPEPVHSRSYRTPGRRHSGKPFGGGGYGPAPGFPVSRHPIHRRRPRRGRDRPADRRPRATSSRPPSAKTPTEPTRAYTRALRSLPPGSMAADGLFEPRTRDLADRRRRNFNARTRAELRHGARAPCRDAIGNQLSNIRSAGRARRQCADETTRIRALGMQKTAQFTCSSLALGTMQPRTMQARIAVLAGVVGLLWVLAMAALEPAAVPALVAIISLVAFVWAGVAFLNPTWGPLPTRRAGAIVFAAGIGLFIAAGTGFCRW